MPYFLLPKIIRGIMLGIDTPPNGFISMALQQHLNAKMV